MDILAYIAAHKARFMDEWASLIRIPSVSCQAEHKADMMRCAERWKELLLEAGCQHAEVMPSAGNPFVYAEYQCSVTGNPSPLTVLVYAHYDVMPVEPIELWQSDPWEPDIRDGRLNARVVEHIKTCTQGS